MSLALEAEAPPVKRRRLSKAERARRRQRHELRICAKHPRSQRCRDATRHRRKGVETSATRRGSRPTPTGKRRTFGKGVKPAQASAAADEGDATATRRPTPTLPIVTARPPPVANDGPPTVASAQARGPGSATPAAGNAPVASTSLAPVPGPSTAAPVAIPLALTTSSTPAFPLSTPLLGVASMSASAGPQSTISTASTASSIAVKAVPAALGGVILLGLLAILALLCRRRRKAARESFAGLGGRPIIPEPRFRPGSFLASVRGTLSNMGHDVRQLDQVGEFGTASAGRPTDIFAHRFVPLPPTQRHVAVVRPPTPPRAVSGHSNLSALTADSFDDFGRNHGGASGSTLSLSDLASARPYRSSRSWPMPPTPSALPYDDPDELR